jgi:hypothetical protein
MNIMPYKTNKNLFMVSICEVKVFDEFGNYVAEFKTLTNSIVKIKKSTAKIVLNDATFNPTFYHFAYGADADKLKSDYERMVNGNPKMVFRGQDWIGKPCKLVVKSELRGNNNEITSYQILNFPLASIDNNFKQVQSADSVSSPLISFTAYPFDDEGSIFEMKLEGLL